jgi:hypothetical protein
MTPSVMTSSVVGRRCGSVTALKLCQRLAPSMTAASSTSAGTSCSAARNMSRNVPVVVHTTSMMITDVPDARARTATATPTGPGWRCRPGASGGAPMSQMPTAVAEQVQQAARVGEPGGSVDADEAEQLVHDARYR